MINIKVDSDSIHITAETGEVFAMNWLELKDLEKAIAALRKLEQAASFDKLEMNLP